MSSTQALIGGSLTAGYLVGRVRGHRRGIRGGIVGSDFTNRSLS